MKSCLIINLLVSIAAQASAESLRGIRPQRKLDLAWVGGPDLARNQMVTASSTDIAYPILRGAQNLVDGNGGTRWASGKRAGDNQTAWIDLGEVFVVDRIRLGWEAAHAKSYELWLSTDAKNWTTVYSTDNCTGGFEDLRFEATEGKYARLELLTQATEWGFSLWDFEVYPAQENATQPASEPTVGLPAPTTQDLARSSTVYASTTSTRGGSTGFAAQHIVDGNNATRWSSEYSDRQWLGIDLGGVHSIGRIRIGWEDAYAESYELWVSSDASNWTNMYATNSSLGGFEDLVFESQEAQYIHMNLLTRASSYGFSMWDFEVYEAFEVYEDKPALEANEDGPTMSHSNEGWYPFEP